MGRSSQLHVVKLYMYKGVGKGVGGFSSLRVSISLLDLFCFPGGCCKVCGSVEHLKSSCPERLKNQCKSEGEYVCVLSHKQGNDLCYVEFNT